MSEYFKNNDRVIVRNFFGVTVEIICKIKGVGSKNIYTNAIESYIVEPIEQKGMYSCYVINARHIEKCNDTMNTEMHGSK